jgi:hypothetical protein
MFELWMRRTILSFALLAFAALPCAAQASTATTADGNLRYTAAPGEVNNVTFTRVSGNTFRATDVGAVIVAGTGCTQESPNVVSCTTGNGRPIIATLGDQNDRAASRTSRGVQFFGEDGNDRLAGASGRDTVDGGNGDDSLTGGSGRDRVRGGAGNDQLFGNSGNDNLQGGDGTDLLDGGSGNDTESGGNGDDTLRQGSAPNGADNLSGDSGNDTVDYSARSAPVNVAVDDQPFDGDRRNDDGGPGIDQIRLRDLSQDDVVCGDGVDSVAADERDTVAPDCEKARRTAAMSLALAARAAYPTVMIRLVCPPSAFKECGGRVIVRTLGKVRTRTGARTLTLGVKRFSLPSGSERTVGVRIRAGAKPYLGRGGIVTRTTLSAFDGAGPARKDAIRYRLLPR